MALPVLACLGNTLLRTHPSGNLRSTRVVTGERHELQGGDERSAGQFRR